MKSISGHNQICYGHIAKSSFLLPTIPSLGEQIVAKLQNSDKAGETTQAVRLTLAGHFQFSSRLHFRLFCDHQSGKQLNNPIRYLKLKKKLSTEKCTFPTPVLCKDKELQKNTKFSFTSSLSSATTKIQRQSFKRIGGTFLSFKSSSPHSLKLAKSRQRRSKFRVGIPRNSHII